ncbi:MAG: rane-bound lytic transglycosylase [Proteobacteria bacterium]|nr:rane-bound lytic transglycosylase [Pseudomonadota bacterium]
MMSRSKAFTLALLGVLVLSACASKPPVRQPVRAVGGRAVVVPIERPIAIPERLGDRHSQPIGRYRSDGVYGDYAGYEAVDRFIDRMASKHGFPREYLNGLFSRVQRKQWTLDYLARQAAPAATPRPGAWTRYRSQFLTEQHISGGVAFWRRHADSLRRASERYGVPPEYIIGIMGVETIYGRNVGSHRVVDALTTLAFDYPRRADYFAEELENFLLMTRDEGIDPARPVGSYAGAMGLGQFMPGSFHKWAVDFDQDGLRDLWEPEDVVGSIANYFAQHGWRRGEPVVTRAVAYNGSVQYLESGYDSRYSLAELLHHGIRPAEPCPDGQALSLLRLRAVNGDEYWLGHRNFYVITRYNHSTHYAMAVHQLAQAVRERYLGS